MPEIETSRSELLQLYVERRLTQHQIADHFGVTIANVRARFKREGIPARMERFKPQKPPLEREPLEDMYVRRGMTVNEIAKELRAGDKRVLRSLRHHGIALRIAGPRIKHPELRTLAVGESVLLPRDRAKQDPFHSMARVAGIRISVERAGDDFDRVTRVE
jgi:hypothetical protein